MIMWKWGNEIHIILGILTGVFITVGLELRQEIPQMGVSFVVLGGGTFVILVVSLAKGRKRYGVAEVAKDMQSMSETLADFAGERERHETVSIVRRSNPNWDDDRKQEEFEKQRQELIGYGSETMSIYRRRFASRVRFLVKKARKLGYGNKELDSLCEHPVNRLAIQMLSDRMGELSLRMKKEIE